MRRFSATLLVLVLVLAVHSLRLPVARADNLQTEKAVALFEEGRRLASETRYGEACERFQQSLSLAEGIGTRFNLADCWEHLGRTASAQALFAQVAGRAAQSGQLDRAKLARERAAALEARVARLSIEVEEPSRGLTVRRNGMAVSESDWGKALPVDPGSYTIEATALHRIRFARSVQVPATASVVMVIVPKLVAPPQKTSSEADDEPRARGAPSVPSPIEPAQQATERRLGPLGISLTALGVTGLAVGSVFLLKYRSANQDAKDICATSSVVCSRADIDRHEELVQDAKQARVGTFVGYGVGGTALAAALISYLFPSPNGAPDRGNLVLNPVIAGGGAGLFASGRF
jgi:hypothetical protein